MQADGWGSRDGQQPRAGDNVVRFPGDWIGPREELVPFGAAADALDASMDVNASLDADAFWGENSASLHEAVQPPRVDTPRSLRAVPRAASSAHPSRRARGSWRTLELPRLRFKLVAPGAAACLAVVAVIALSAGFGASVSTRKLSLAAVGSSKVGRRAPADDENAAAGLRAGQVADTEHHGATRLRKPAAHVKLTRRAHSRTDRSPATTSVTGGSVTPSYNGEPVSDTTSQTIDTSTGSDESAAEDSGEVSGAEPSSSTPSETSADSTSAAGPTGPGAPFGPGTQG